MPGCSCECRHRDIRRPEGARCRGLPGVGLERHDDFSAASSGYILYFPQIVAEFFLIYDEERRWQLVCFHICGSRKDLEKGEFKQ